MKTLNTFSRLNTRTLAKTGLTLFALAVGIAVPATHQYAFAQADKMSQTDKMVSGLKGTFAQVTHATKGIATLSTQSGKRTVRLSSFETAKGPQLRVFLVAGTSQDNASIKRAVASGKFIDLGALKTLKGNQSYAVPASSKLGKGASVIIWCDKFDVAFGSAALS